MVPAGRGFAGRLDSCLHAGRVVAAVLGGEIIHLQLVDGEGRAEVEMRNMAARKPSAPWCRRPVGGAAIDLAVEAG
jgi:hypothetical protein